MITGPMFRTYPIVLVRRRGEEITDFHDAGAKCARVLFGRRDDTQLAAEPIDVDRIPQKYAGS